MQQFPRCFEHLWTGIERPVLHMSATFLSLHYHVVFATKDRHPTIAPEWRSRLHEYLGGIIRGLGGTPDTIGGVADHVHILMGLRATHCLSDLMREIKKAASFWVHDNGPRSFAWQEGYAAFSVSASSLDGVRGYIRRQEEHHKARDFREELREFLDRAGISYDPRYLP